MRAAKFMLTLLICGCSMMEGLPNPDQQLRLGKEAFSNNEPQGNVLVREGLYLGQEGQRLHHGNPGLLRRQVVLDTAGRAVTMGELLGPLEKASNMAVSMDGDALGRDIRFAFRFRGGLKQLMQLITSRYDVAWQVSDGHLTIHGQEAESFELPGIAGTTSRAQIMSAGSNNGLSGASRNTSREAVIDPFGETVGQLTQLAGPDGKVEAAPSLGVITVTARPSAMARIKKHMESFGSLLAKQIVMDVEVFEVNLSNSQSFGLDLDLLAKLGDLELAANALGGVAGGAANIGIGILSGPAAGSQAFLNILGRAGQASLSQKVRLTTLSGRPAPLQVGRELAFVERVRRGVESDGDARFTEIMPGRLQTGLALDLLPRVQRNGEIIMQVDVQITELVRLSDFALDDGAIQLPETASRHVMETVRMAPGKSLLIAGFEGRVLRDDKKGPGISDLFFLPGGKRELSGSRTMSLVLVTPRIMEPRP
ncbi:MAG: hypothetical protein CML57_09435 [Rhodobacteraceae bacterium]|nr:hypothetical protein [Paracoccaceae bacterium]|tara:strand:+ start:1901 stop:3343 length:1443 start_codon:yes stop_codon:yes gene_type:complete